MRKHKHHHPLRVKWQNIEKCFGPDIKMLKRQHYFFQALLLKDGIKNKGGWLALVCRAKNRPDTILTVLNDSKKIHECSEDKTQTDDS